MGHMLGLRWPSQIWAEMEGGTIDQPINRSINQSAAGEAWQDHEVAAARPSGVRAMPQALPQSLPQRAASARPAAQRRALLLKGRHGCCWQAGMHPPCECTRQCPARPSRRAAREKQVRGGAGRREAVVSESSPAVPRDTAGTASSIHHAVTRAARSRPSGEVLAGRNVATGVFNCCRQLIQGRNLRRASGWRPVRR